MKNGRVAGPPGLRHVSERCQTQCRSEQAFSGSGPHPRCQTRVRHVSETVGLRAERRPVARPLLLDAFGRPRREIACECERTDSPNMTQALQLLTGSLLNSKVQNPQGRVASFCRPPSDAELKGAVTLVGQAPNVKEGLEDLLWAMLNSREFQFVQ